MNVNSKGEEASSLSSETSLKLTAQTSKAFYLNPLVHNSLKQHFATSTTTTTSIPPHANILTDNSQIRSQTINLNAQDSILTRRFSKSPERRESLQNNILLENNNSELISKPINDAYSSFFDDSEQTPLLPNNEQQKSAKKSAFFIPYIAAAIYSLPAVFLGLMLTLLDAMAYGIIIFPATDVRIPVSAGHVGISMFLFSSFISQFTLSIFSGFMGANGSMMIEVIPFLHLMCRIVEAAMVDDSNEAVLSTIVVCYALSTIFTGLVFLALGYFKLGNVVQFFPRHILIGCIGGIGVFLFITGIEVSSGMKPDLSNFFELFEISHMKVWATSFSLAVLLKILQTKIKHPLFVPIFYAIIPFVFYFITSLILGLSIEQLRHQGWLFNLSSDTAVPWYTFWTYYDFNLVSSKAVLQCFPTMLALTFFGILHVPINVPALSVSTQQDVDINDEIINHGISNLISGCLGSTQNYLVYTNSVLVYRSGGNTRTSGAILTTAIGLIMVFGGSVIGFVPILVVGALIFHLAIDLVKESVYDTYKAGINKVDYVTILLIIVVMTCWGFTEGIIAGIGFACVFFVLMYSRRSIIKLSCTGAELRSTVHRLYRQQKFLDLVGSQTRVLKLQGYLFFGTIHQLVNHVRDELGVGSVENPSFRFLIFDFSSINGIDYSGTEAFSKLKRILREHNIHLLFAGLDGQGKEEIFSNGVLDDIEFDDEFDDERPLTSSLSPERLVHSFQSLDDALEFSENSLLKTYYDNLKRLENLENKDPVGIFRVPDEVNKDGPVDDSESINEDDMFCFTPRNKFVQNAADIVLKNQEDLVKSGRARNTLQNQFSSNTAFKKSGSPTSLTVLSTKTRINWLLEETFSEIFFNLNSNFKTQSKFLGKSPVYTATTQKESIKFLNNNGTLSLHERTSSSTSNISNNTNNIESQEQKDERTATLAKDIKALSTYFEMVEIGRNTVLWENGDEADSIYVVDSGELEMLVSDSNRYQVIETLLHGTMIGELELFSNSVRSSSLVASADSILFKMTRESYERMVSANASLAVTFTRMALSFDSVRIYGVVSHLHSSK